MRATVLVACDSDDRAPAAFARVVAPLLDARVALVRVLGSGGLAGTEADDGPGGRRLTGVRVEHATSAAAGLQRLIADEHPALTVLGSSHDAVFGRVRTGTTSDRVMVGAPGPIVVVPRGNGERPLRSIAVGLLPTPDAMRALRAAVALARAAAVPLLVLAILRRSPTAADAAAFASCVAPAFTLSGPPAKTLRTAISAAVRTIHEGSPTAALTPEAPLAPAAPHSLLSPRGDAAGALTCEPLVLIGDAADALLRVSARVDLLVLGSRGYGPPGVVLPGGAARRVLTDARCPVLVVPRAEVPAAVPVPA